MKGLIIGTGRAGTYLHFGAMELNGIKVVAFVDQNENNKHYVIEKLKCKFYTNLIQALDECTVDVVSICSSTSSHLSLAKICLNRNLNVIIEKPITETFEELTELKNSLSNSKGSISAMHNHKFYPGIEKAFEMVKQGYCGNILSISREMSFNFDNVRMMEFDHWAHSLPGGRLMEANPHNLYLFYNLVGNFELVDVFKTNSKLNFDFVDNDSLLMLFKSHDNKLIDCRMNLNYNSQFYGKHAPNYFLVRGDKASLFFDYNKIFDVTFMNKRKLIFNSNSFKKVFLQKIHIFLSRFKFGVPFNVNSGISSGHYFFYSKYLVFLKTKKNQPVTFDESYYTQKLNSLIGSKLKNVKN
jgi:predicted dehydrogenase